MDTLTKEECVIFMRNKKIEKLEQKLAIAVKALKKIDKSLATLDLSGLDYDNRHKIYDIIYADGIIEEALKKIEEVK